MISKLLDRLGWVKRFTQLDLTNIYHQIRIYKSDEWKTALKTRYRHFEYQIMLFGLFNTPAMFQEYVNKVLAEKFDIFIIVYLNNFLIYIKDPK